MTEYQGTQKIKQLEPIKGAYFYLKINAEIVEQFEKKRATRLICTLDDIVSCRCGLNHLGDGNFFIIVAKKWLVKLNKELGDEVHYKIEKDPDQLGVKMPEVLTTLLAQDSEAKAIFEKLTDGKKRSLIYSIQKVKDIDLSVRKILDFLEEQGRKMS
ncbi:MAG: YdeI/OmpD-associated family protein [Pricia sp.]